jgi:hypothetical protein
LEGRRLADGGLVVGAGKAISKDSELLAAVGWQDVEVVDDDH